MDLRHPGTDSGGFNFGGGDFGGGGFGTQRDLARAWGEEIEKRLTGGTLDRENAARLARRWLRAEIQSGYFRVMPNEWPEDEPLRLVQFATPFDLRVRTNVTVALVTSHGTILAFAVSVVPCPSRQRPCLGPGRGDSCSTLKEAEHADGVSHGW